MALLQMPDSWTTATEGVHCVTVSGTTVRQALAELTSRYPALHRRVFTTDGRIGGWLAIYIGDERAAPGAPIDDAVVLTVLPALAGG
ncbi:hypothetical protein ACFV4P_15595 [Kitasatospora sp. NPDC059795]|uniref:hypothetical protein n=1 Tax=Kitasatospora sp. NPDC059795 TaxID=3346949 RepID=UPI00365DA8A0